MRARGFIVGMLIALACGVIAEPAEVGYLGVVIPKQQFDVTSEVAGRIETITVALGDSVSADQLLVKIHVPGLARQIAQAEADVLAARSGSQRTAIELQELERQLERRSSTDNVFSAEELEALELDRQIKRAELDEANAVTKSRESELELLNERLSSLRIVAPYTGLVAMCPAVEGSFVQPGQSLLRIVGNAPPFLRFAVPATEGDWLVPGAEIEVWLDAQNPQRAHWTARVERVAPEIDPESEMFLAEATFTDVQLQGAPRAAGITSGAVVRVRQRSR